MITVDNFSGAVVPLTVDGVVYLMPLGRSKLEVNSGANYEVTFGGSGGPPPPPGTNSFTSFGSLKIWEDSYEFQPGESSVFYLFEGFVLGIVIFGGGFIIRIVRNALREAPL